MNSLAYERESAKEATVSEFKRLKREIESALRIQSEKHGNKNAEWLRRHL